MDNIKIYTVFKGTDREFVGNKKEISDHFNISYDSLNGRIKKRYEFRRSY